jgi:hypothetical protein
MRCATAGLTGSQAALLVEMAHGALDVSVHPGSVPPFTPSKAAQLRRRGAQACPSPR